jgi:hypothetical protein
LHRRSVSSLCCVTAAAICISVLLVLLLLSVLLCTPTLLSAEIAPSEGAAVREFRGPAIERVAEGGEEADEGGALKGNVCLRSRRRHQVGVGSK